MVKTRTTVSHQHSRADRDSVCNKDIQGHQGSDGHDKDGQHDLCSLHQPSGRYSLTNVINHSGGNMEPVFGTEYTYKSRTRTWCNEHNSRSSFEDKKDCHDWKLCPKTFQIIDRIWGPHHLDLFASHHNSQLHRYFSW